jgi:hypothetical protein
VVVVVPADGDATTTVPAVVPLAGTVYNMLAFSESQIFGSSLTEVYPVWPFATYVVVVTVGAG